MAGKERTSQGHTICPPACCSVKKKGACGANKIEVVDGRGRSSDGEELTLGLSERSGDSTAVDRALALGDLPHSFTIYPCPSLLGCCKKVSHPSTLR